MEDESVRTEAAKEKEKKSPWRVIKEAGAAARTLYGDWPQHEKGEGGHKGGVSHAIYFISTKK